MITTLSFGRETQRIDMPVLKSGKIDISFGSATLDLRGCDHTTADSTLDVDCAFANLTLIIPSRFRAEADSDTAFGNLSISGTPDPNPDGVIRLNCDIAFGEMKICYK